jgi:predicted CopG family antitoxin
MPKKFENIPQTIERSERADYLVDFFDRINADHVLGSEETKREFIKNISFEDFKGWVVRVNGMLRSIPIKERSLDGKDVALVPNPDQVSKLETAFLGERKPEYPPREADKEELLKEMFELAQKMEAQGASLYDIALLFSVGINAVHPFEDGNGRTSRLLNYLVNTDYTGTKEQADFLKKLLGEKGRLLINIDPGDAKDAVTNYILCNQLNIGPEDRNLPKNLGQTYSKKEVQEKMKEKVPQEILPNFQRYILDEEDDFGFFAVYSFLKKKGKINDFLSPVKNREGIIRRTDLSITDLAEKLEPDEFSEILEEYWQIKKDSVSILMHAIAEPNKFKIEKRRYEWIQGETIKENFLASLDKSYLTSFKEVNMENIEEIWTEKDKLPFSADKISSEEMRRLSEINIKLGELKEQEKNERAALGFDFEKADREFGVAEQDVQAMRSKEFSREDSTAKIEHDKQLEIMQKQLYETKRRIYEPVIDLENRYLEKVIQFLDSLDIWETKFTTRDENRFGSEEEKEATDSIYYVTKSGQSLRIRKYSLLKDGLSGSIEPFMEKIFYIDNQYENFRNRANVSEQVEKGLFVMEYTTDEFQEAQNNFATQEFMSRVKRYEKDGKIIYLNPVDGYRHRGYSVNRIL